MESVLDSVSQKLNGLVTDLKQKASDSVDAEMANMPLFQKQKLLRTKSITQTKLDQLNKTREIRTAQEESR